MFNGEKINWTENRSVLHTALRDKSKKSIIINNKNIKIDIQKVLDKVGYVFKWHQKWFFKRIYREKI